MTCGIFWYQQMSADTVRYQEITSERWAVTAEAAGSSPVVPAIQNKDFTCIPVKPSRVQKDTDLHPFVLLSLAPGTSLLWFPQSVLPGISEKLCCSALSEYQRQDRRLRGMLRRRHRLRVYIQCRSER